MTQRKGQIKRMLINPNKTPTNGRRGDSNAPRRQNQTSKASKDDIKKRVYRKYDPKSTPKGGLIIHHKEKKPGLLERLSDFFASLPAGGGGSAGGGGIMPPDIMPPEVVKQLTPKQQQQAMDILKRYTKPPNTTIPTNISGSLKQFNKDMETIGNLRESVGLPRYEGDYNPTGKAPVVLPEPVPIIEPPKSPKAPPKPAPTSTTARKPTPEQLSKYQKMTPEQQTQYAIDNLKKYYPKGPQTDALIAYQKTPEAQKARQQAINRWSRTSTTQQKASKTATAPRASAPKTTPKPAPKPAPKTTTSRSTSREAYERQRYGGKTQKEYYASAPKTTPKPAPSRSTTSRSTTSRPSSSSRSTTSRSTTSRPAPKPKPKTTPKPATRTQPTRTQPAKAK